MSTCRFPLDSPDPWPQAYDPAATEADILACFRLLLGRNPNPEEWPGHSARAGEPLPAVVASYVNSLEYARRRLQEPPGAAPAIAELAGFRIFADPEDLAVGKSVLSGQYEPEVMAAFRDVLRPGMGVIDVGANIGVFSMLAASLVGPAGWVLGVEPNRRNARMAEASRRLNGFGHLTILQAAAARGPGLLAMNTSFSNGTTSSVDDCAVLEAETVGCVPIDAVSPRGRRVNLVKLDIEGAEYNALLGCRGLLRRYRPVLVLEFGPGQLPGVSGVTGEELLQWVVAQGYGLEVIELAGPPRPHGSNWSAVMQAYEARGRDHIDIIARPRSRWRGFARRSG